MGLTREFAKRHRLKIRTTRNGMHSGQRSLTQYNTTLGIQQIRDVDITIQRVLESFLICSGAPSLL